MQLIRCTKKLQKEMGLKQSDLCAEEPCFSYLGSWHVNLIHFDRRKCVLFVNDKTLFNFKRVHKKNGGQRRGNRLGRRMSLTTFEETCPY